MILRRVIAHFRKQEWTAIFLDFLIVVVGVFVGLQVNIWNTARLDRVDAVEILGSLEQDFLQRLDRSERSVRSHESALAATGRLIDGARTGQFADQSINDDIRIATVIATPPGPSTAFQALKSGGRLQLVESEELRRKLHEYDDYVTFVRDQYGNFTSPISAASSALIRAQTIVVTGTPSQDFSGIGAVASVDQSVLIGNAEVINALQEAHITQDNIHFVLRRNRDEVRHILDLIKAEKEKAG